jgi:membrane protein YdbS with pleckstrin-like domain
VTGDPVSPAHDDRAPKPAAAWIYEGVWSVLTEWLRVPREPSTLPTSDGTSQRSFRPAPAFLGYLKLWFWIVAILVDLLILVAWIAITVSRWWVGLLLLPVAVVLAILPDVLAYIAVHLRFDTTWYVMSDRSLRIRRGAWIVQEMTFTFENVQNVRVQQGPIQRLFGIASVMIETAGSGRDDRGRGLGVSNRGVIEGVTDAAAIRDVIAARLRRSRTTGLGDEDETALPAGSAWTPEHVAVLREIRELVR